MEYQFVKIDLSDPAAAPVLAAKYKTLRLQALLQSPAAFSSTYEIEVQFPDETWISRLQTPGKETFACIATSEGKSEWVAQVTIRGPIPSRDYQLPEASGQKYSKADEESEKWQMLSLYTLPSHRGQGLGKKLCQTAFDYLTSSRGQGSAGIIVRIMVKPENSITLGMYASLGFEETGRCRLVEALKANGDEELIPQGELSEKYTARTGIIMAARLEQR